MRDLDDVEKDLTQKKLDLNIGEVYFGFKGDKNLQ